MVGQTNKLLIMAQDRYFNLYKKYNNMMSVKIQIITVTLQKAVYSKCVFNRNVHSQQNLTVLNQ
jgi:hypothetical protein